MLDHGLGVDLNDGAGGYMKVYQHDIDAPSAHQLDGVTVHLAEEQGHGATGTEGAGGDIPRNQADFLSNG